MSDTLLLRARPTTVEARRITAENRDELVEWVNEVNLAWPYGTQGITWYDTPLRAIQDARVGDWLVKTAFGEMHKVSDSVIFARYEAVT